MVQFFAFPRIQLEKVASRPVSELLSMANKSPNSIPWHTVFAFQIQATGTIVQSHFVNSSPLDEHPAIIWIFIVCSIFYCIALGYHIKCQIYTPADTTSLNRSVTVAFISGTLGYTAQLSLLIPRPLQPLVFIVYLLLLFLYFNYKRIAEISENTASYLMDLWKRAKRRASFMYEYWKRTESSDVPVSNQP